MSEGSIPRITHVHDHNYYYHMQLPIAVLIDHELCLLGENQYRTLMMILKSHGTINTFSEMKVKVKTDAEAPTAIATYTTVRFKWLIHGDCIYIA